MFLVARDLYEMFLLYRGKHTTRSSTVGIWSTSISCADPWIYRGPAVHRWTTTSGSASRHHKGDAVEADRNFLCWEIDFASATDLQSSNIVSKSFQVKWRKRLKQDQRKCADLQ